MIFSKSGDKNVERLKSVLISDKQFNSEKLERVLKSDMYSLLSNYCVVEPSDIDIEIDLQKDGKYHFNISATSYRLKIFGSLPEVY